MMNNNNRITTGLFEFDEENGGINISAVSVLSLESKDVKNDLLLKLMNSTAVNRKIPTFLLSTEVESEELLRQLISLELDIDTGVFDAAALSDDEFSKLNDRTAKLYESPLFIDDSTDLNLDELRSIVRQLKDENDLQMVVLDSAGFSESADALSDLAANNRVAVICISCLKQ